MISRNNQKAKLATDYNDLLKELSSHEMTSVGLYTIGETIGEGSFGKVKLGKHQLTGKQVAIKKISKQHAPMIAREIHLHRQLKHHPNVVTLYEIIITESYIHVVSEYCPHGELFDALALSGRFSEHDTIRWFSQLVNAIQYCHSQDIVHRDLKLENILLDQQDNIKLCDFGFARHAENRQMLETFCGSLAYSAPEVILRQKYTGPETDIWSLGVILYTLLAGELPFDDDSEIITQRKIIKGDYVIPSYFSKEVSDLIRRMLKLNPSERVTLDQIVEHPWLHHHHCQECDMNNTTPSTSNSSHSDDFDSIFSIKRDISDTLDDNVSLTSSSSSIAEIKSDRRLSPQEKFSPQVRYSLGMMSQEQMARRQQQQPLTPPRSPRFSASFISTMNATTSRPNIISSLSPSTSSSFMHDRPSLPNILPSHQHHVSLFRDHLMGSSNHQYHYDYDYQQQDESMTVREQQLAMTLELAGLNDQVIRDMRVGNCNALNGLWSILFEQQQSISSQKVPEVRPSLHSTNDEQIKSTIIVPDHHANNKPTITNGNTRVMSEQHAIDAATQTTSAGLLNKQQNLNVTNNNNYASCSNNSSSNKQQLQQSVGSWFVSMKTWFSISGSDQQQQQNNNKRPRSPSQSYRNVDAPLQQRGNTPRRYWDDDDEKSTPGTHCNGEQHDMHRSLSNLKHKRRVLQLSEPPQNELDQYDYYSTSSAMKRRSQRSRVIAGKSCLDSKNVCMDEDDDDGVVGLVKPPKPAATPSRSALINTLSIVTTAGHHETKEIDICEKRYSMMATKQSMVSPLSPDTTLSISIPPMAASSSSSLMSPPQSVSKKTITRPPSYSALPSSPQQKQTRRGSTSSLLALASSSNNNIITQKTHTSSDNLTLPISSSILSTSLPYSTSSDESGNSSSGTCSSSEEEEEMEDPISPALSLPTCRLDNNKPTQSRPQNLVPSSFKMHHRVDFTPRSRLNVYGYNPSMSRFSTKAIIEEEEEEED